jgi:hypothetical protein
MGLEACRSGCAQVFVSTAAELCDAMRQAAALGCEFRIHGADVEIDGLSPILEPIERARRTGYLYSWLGADDADAEALSFCQKLGIEPVLVETREQAIAAVRELGHPAFVGVDIETSALPQYASPGSPSQ